MRRSTRRRVNWREYALPYALLALSPLLAYVAIGGDAHEIPVKEARTKREFRAGRLKIALWAEAERIESEPLVPLQLLPPRR